MAKFNEDSRVKIPALVHLTRLGYSFIPKTELSTITDEACIYRKLFHEGLVKINGRQFNSKEIDSLMGRLQMKLGNMDLGKSFFECLKGDFPCRLIDLEDFDNNLFHVVTELTYKNGEEEFRPDITIMINGMPLAFIEVKKPNNYEGMIAERDRTNTRFKKPAFNRFMNVTQLLVFSNNMEYDEENADPIQGAFYASPDSDQVKFNHFREEDLGLHFRITAVDPLVEKQILKDTNLVACLGTAEYATNSDPRSPTNRILTSLLSRERLSMILKYGIVYVRAPDASGSNRLEKHIMRYPQLFATKEIERSLSAGSKGGVIWHTQGSGKTALAYYNVPFLTDYFHKHGVVAKFYFVVDRLDLAQQASDEFKARGLLVEVVDSKEDFIRNIGSVTAGSGNRGEHSITVVNIQKFSEDSVARTPDYAINIQRVYFLDEVHRSYNPKGSFLANLMASDREAVMIGLTGTPLISDEIKTTKLFGTYIHKYYYNKSISDGYTLRLIREGIETSFRASITKVYDELVEKGGIDSQAVLAHEEYVSPLVDYILEDFRRSRVIHNEPGIGCMIVCDSSEQARMIHKRIKETNEARNPGMTVSHGPAYRVQSSTYKTALVLHDEGTKQNRKDDRSDFKSGGLSILVVYNMLLTGFDAPRLKKLYLLRKIDRHNLLQTLTRVNRPYKKFRYGYVVDFADIRAEFDKTNQDYLKELNAELGDEAVSYSNLFKSPEEIEAEIAEIREKLFIYDLHNLETFQHAVSELSDKKELLDLLSCFDKLKALYNTVRIMGYVDLTGRVEFENIGRLASEVQRRIATLNFTEALANSSDSSSILNQAMESIQFVFTKISEDELHIADEFRTELEKARIELEGCFDKKDPEFISLFEELKRLFKKKGIEELNAAEMKSYIRNLKALRKKAKAVNDKDSLLAAKYEGDPKFARVHKRVQEHGLGPIKGELALNALLLEVKHRVDEMILDNRALLGNEEYFSEETKSAIIDTLEAEGIRDMDLVRFMSGNLAQEYLDDRAA
jgi:type I restriction enzyme R subunit